MLDYIYIRKNKKVICDIVEKSSEGAEKMDRLPMPIIETGIKEYDSTYLGLWSEELMMIVSPSDKGKKALQLNIIRNIVKQYGDRAWVICFNLEEGRRQILTALLGIESGHDPWMISTGHINDIDYLMLRNRAQQVSSWPIIIDDDYSLKGIIKRCKRYNTKLIGERAGMLRIILINNFHLVNKHINMFGTNEENRINMCQAFKALAKELDATVILLGSLTEDGLRRKSSLPRKTEIKNNSVKGSLNR